MLQVGVHLIDDGGEDGALHHEKGRGKPEAQKHAPVREEGLPPGGAAHHEHEYGGKEKASRAAEGRQGVGKGAQKEKPCPSAGREEDAHQEEQGHIIADEVRENGMPFLGPPGNDAGKAEEKHPLPAQGIAEMGEAGHGRPENPSGHADARGGGKLLEHHPREQHVAGGPGRRSQGHEQGKEQGDEIGVVKAEQRAREKAGGKTGQEPRGHAGLKAAEDPDPGRHDAGHEARQDSGEPEGHGRGFGVHGKGHEAEHLGHGMPGAEAEVLGARHPVIGVVGGEEKLRAEPVLGIIPGRPFQHAHAEGEEHGHPYPEYAPQALPRIRARRGQGHGEIPLCLFPGHDQFSPRRRAQR